MSTLILAFGEVRTGILLNTLPLDRAGCERALDLGEGEAVTWASRPVSHATTPPTVIGVDCLMPSAIGASCRGVGTVTGHVSLIGGRVLQASAHTELHPVGPGTRGMRGSWEAYLALPGVIGALGKYTPHDVASGFLTSVTAAGDPKRLNVTAVAERLAARVQSDGVLDRTPPFRARPTRLRWTAVAGGERNGTATGELTVVDDAIRTLRLVLPPGVDPAGESTRAAVEDIALHDWLLTCVAETAERSATGGMPIEQVASVVEQLVHLWMPGARRTHEDTPLSAVWSELERWPGMSRQWRVCADRLRDRLLVHAVRQGAVHA